MKHGFTLVELSIVLVIIGLLIGGILVGQSLISAAKVQSAVRQIQQFDIAIHSFQAKFGGLPGDAVAFGGDGSGRIDDGDINTGNVNYFSGEAGNFWVHLQQSGFVYEGKTFTTTIPAGGFNSNSASPNAPKFKIGIEASVVLTSGIPLSGNGNTYGIGNWTGLAAGFDFLDFETAVLPADVTALDNKIDDGKPVSGNVNASLYGQAMADFGITTCDDYNGGNASTARYLIEVTEPRCLINIGILGQILGTPAVV